MVGGCRTGRCQVQLGLGQWSPWCKWVYSRGGQESSQLPLLGVSFLSFSWLWEGSIQFKQRTCCPKMQTFWVSPFFFALPSPNQRRMNKCPFCVRCPVNTKRWRVVGTHPSRSPGCSSSRGLPSSDQLTLCGGKRLEWEPCWTRLWLLGRCYSPVFCMVLYYPQICMKSLRTCFTLLSLLYDP